ncbi:Zona pellucida sperm-binding protein 2, partial [Ophiophagus hannah]
MDHLPEKFLSRNSQLCWTGSFCGFYPQDNKPRLRFRLQFNATEGVQPQNETYSVDCDTLQADEALSDNGFASSTTNCSKNIMAQDDHVLYTVAIKLTYGPPEQRLTLESRMICAPGPAVCNSTHMMVILPAFPGKLTAVSLNEKNLLVHQLQANGIGVDTRKGAYRDHDCSGVQFYVASLTLNFDYGGEIATMVSYPECPCEQNAPIDGHMDFEIASSSTKPDLNLDTLRLRDPNCGPVPWSASKDRVHFRINTLPSPEPAINQGLLSLLLLIYPDQSYSVPYTNDQYPLVKYLRQPIFLEVQVLNRNDPNIHLMLENCWATLSLEPSCEYELDNYKTIFHPVGPAVSYANFRQRFEVKAFAFVSDGKALSKHVYFHCSVIICDRQRPDSPLCSSRCPRSFRKRR